MTILWMLSCSGIALKVDSKGWEAYSIHSMITISGVSFEKAISEFRSSVLTSLKPGFKAYNCETICTGVDMETGANLPPIEEVSLFPEPPEPLYIWQYAVTATRQGAPSYPLLIRGFTVMGSEEDLKQAVEQMLRDRYSVDSYGHWYANASKMEIKVLPGFTGHEVEWWPFARITGNSGAEEGDRHA